MPPVTWNESEPFFPDFLPPVETTELTEEQATERLKGVLEAAGITGLLSGCNCCGDMTLTFPDGATYHGNEVGYIEFDGLSHQRG